MSWDVRTKHITYDQIPTLETVRGLAVYGPGAKLFTIGENNTVQQFDLNTPSILMANVQHADVLPPSPPVSVEEPPKSVLSTRSDETMPTMEMNITSSDEDRAMARNHGMFAGLGQFDESSPGSSLSGSSIRGVTRHMSVISHAHTDITYISNTASATSMRSHQPQLQLQQQQQQHHHQQHQHQRQQQQQQQQQQQLQQLQQQQKQQQHYGGYRERDAISTSTRTYSSSKSSVKPRPSRLRHQIGNRLNASNADANDLFKFTQARLSDMPYRHPVPLNGTRLTNNDLRRQMLSTIFGWHGEIDELIRDEMSRHPAGSSCKMLLSSWLGEEDPNMLQNHSETMTNSDWMLLALGSMRQQPSKSKIGRAYVRRLLADGEVHAAVTVMLCLGDQNDAIEIYVSHRKYMEALLLTSFSFPAVWERQAAIIKKWGEYSVQHGQQQLAIRW